MYVDYRCYMPINPKKPIFNIIIWPTNSSFPSEFSNHQITMKVRACGQKN